VFWEIDRWPVNLWYHHTFKEFHSLCVVEALFAELSATGWVPVHAQIQRAKHRTTVNFQQRAYGASGDGAMESEDEM
jgi:hypothetical protein